MTDPTNDIDALLRDLGYSASCGYKPWRHAALTALVAERDELRHVLSTQIEGRDALVAERDALREQLRLANIDQFNTEAEANERDRDLRERDETRGQTWYLLYGGTSEDGMGSGPYIGRTTDKEVARDHHAKCRKNPYSIGFVEIVTDTEKKRVSYYGRELETKKEGGGANAK